jgi:hypothetical protein
LFTQNRVLIEATKPFSLIKVCAFLAVFTKSTCPNTSTSLTSLRVWNILKHLTKVVTTASGTLWRDDIKLSRPSSWRVITPFSTTSVTSQPHSFRNKLDVDPF